MFLTKDAVPQLDWVFLGPAEGLHYDLTLTPKAHEEETRSCYMTWPFVSVSF